MFSREIHIGNLLLGGKNPVVVQSMTNTDTMNTAATVEQTLALVKAGCEMVRITARNTAEAENLQKIKKALAEKNCLVPLIADIHFQPQAAEVAARIVDKVRINPGNYVDKNLREKTKMVYDENRYQKELENISLRLKPLLETCKEYGTAIRIGVNHGSLSERVTSRYGNTVEGLVVSALEYIEICRFYDFQNLVLSMKSSNVKTMVFAYRLLAARMEELGYDYPLHLGVTEAGAGDDARIKSAAGIGELLMEGIGDTIRVSLTENPVKEVPVAKLLVKMFEATRNLPGFVRKYDFDKRETIVVGNIGGDKPPVCISCEQNVLTTSMILPDYYLDLKKACLINPNSHECVKIKIVDEANWTVAMSELKTNTHLSLLFVDFTNSDDLSGIRKKLFDFKNSGSEIPMILYKKYPENTEDILIRASAEFAYFLIDGLVDGICIDIESDRSKLIELMYGILQALGLRRTKAEFIACPTCGRTSYDVEGALRKISTKLSHLKQLKIGVMGCIVNGPGEMADADYGYVGAAAGKINLYRRKQLIRKNIEETQALDELIRIIREDGNWTEPA